VLAEGERDKVLQPPLNNIKIIDEQAKPDQEPEPDVEEPPNSIPFPSCIHNTEPEQASEEMEPDLTSVTDRNIIQGRWARPNPGMYSSSKNYPNVWSFHKVLLITGYWE
jgi:hypothetical protein